MILAIGNVNSAAKALNNEDLFSFRKRMFIAIILGLIGSFFVVVAVSIIVTIATRPDPVSPAAIQAYISAAVVILIGLVFLIIALVFEILAWSDLKGFFRDNKSMFPEKIGENAKTGSLLMILGAIPFVG